MATAAEITKYSNEILEAAKNGTPTNPKGLPPVLAGLLLAQAKHESGNFSSNLFRKYNNAFGYNYVSGARWQTGAGTKADNGMPIAVYASVGDSAREIVDWIYRRVKEGKFPANLDLIRTPDEYAHLLKNAGYYQDNISNYTEGLKNFFQSPKTHGALIMVGMAFAAWYFSNTKDGKNLFKKLTAK